MSDEDKKDPTGDPQDDQSAKDDQPQDASATESTPPAEEEKKPEEEAAADKPEAAAEEAAPAAAEKDSADSSAGDAAATAEGDQSLVCEDCNSEFTFTAGEQEFYTEKGFTPPKRCPTCRQAKKERSREVSDVTCAECGKPTTVPFVPTSDRPVYCRECFESKRN